MLFSKNLQIDLQAIVDDAIKEKIFPGAVIGVIANSTRHIYSFGNFTYDSQSSKMSEESIFDVASVTKSIPTSLLALKLLEGHRLDLNQKVDTILPRFTGKWKKDVRVFHLLTQTVSFGLRLSLLKNRTPDQIIKEIETCDLQSEPGTSYSYTNSTSIVLGRVVEEITGKNLSDAAFEMIFKPLEMNDSSFSPQKFGLKRIVPTEIDSWRGREIRGEVHDESAYTLSKKYSVGSAGLFTSASDLLNVLEMLLSGGMYKNKRVFAQQTINAMHTNQLSKNLQSSGLGWEMHKDFMGKKHSAVSIGKTGYTGCVVFADFEKKVGIVILSNHQYPQRSDINEKYIVRSKIIDMILTAIV